MKKKSFNRAVVCWLVCGVGIFVFVGSLQNPILWCLRIALLTSALAYLILFSAPILVLLVNFKSLSRSQPKQRKNSQLGVNYFLGDDGEIIEIVDEEKRKRSADLAVE